MTKDEYRQTVIEKLGSIEKALTERQETPAVTAQKFTVGETLAVRDFDVPETTIDGQHFEALHVHGAKVVIVDVDEKDAIAVFDHVLFSSAISENYDGEPFSDTPLGKYLDGTFKNAFWQHSLLLTKKDVQVLTVGLPTKYEMFGDGEPESLFTDKPHRIDFFKQGINRIRFDSDEDCSRWHWLASKENSSCFAIVCSYGDAGWTDAGYVGGVSPAIRLA